jgi:hypothetical protein
MYTIRKSTPTRGDIRTTAEFIILEGPKRGNLGRKLEKMSILKITDRPVPDTAKPILTIRYGIAA